MRIKTSRKKASELEADLLVIPVLDGGECSGLVRELATATREALQKRVSTTAFKAKPGATLTLQTESGDVVLVGLGKTRQSENWRRAGGKAAAVAAGLRPSTVAMCSGRGSAANANATALLEGFRLGGYRFDKYRSGDGEDRYQGPETVTLAGAGVTLSSAATERIMSVCESVFLARDLINEMSSVKTPAFLVRTARKVARDGGLSCTVWQGEKLVKEKMNGILAVSAGSAQPGAFIKMVYTPPRKARATVAVVGKGITFDSGGLSLKPAKAMEWMKQDMSGAAAVLGVMQAVAVLKPAVEVRGYIAAAENMPGSGAQKPGDVITYRNGTTAEVLNTDAEGRLVLADALCVASEEKPDVMIDLATLTGACMVALGVRIAGVMGNDQALVDGLLRHGRSSGETMWQLPLVEDYMADIRSATADIQNIGAGYGGAITAALFLRCFVGETKWAHMDIAGPAFNEKPTPYAPKGGTGFGVRALLSYIDSL